VQKCLLYGKPFFMCCSLPTGRHRCYIATGDAARSSCSVKLSTACISTTPRAGPWHVGAPGRCPLKVIFLTLFRPSTELANLIDREGVPTLPIIFGEILPRVETWVYWRHITDCSNDVLRPRAAARLARPAPAIGKFQIRNTFYRSNWCTLL